MKFLDRRFTTASFVALLAASPVAADLTAQDVWADWQTTATEMGQTLSAGSEEASGSGLTLRDVSITMDGPDAAMNGTIAEIVMTDVGDGSVSISMSPEFPFDVSMTPPEGEPGSFSMIVGAPDLAMVASGAPGAISYAFSGPSMTVSMSDMTANEQPVDMTLGIVVTDLAGTYRVEGTEPRRIASDFAAQSMKMNASGTDPEGGTGTFDMTIDMSDIRSTSEGTMSAIAGMTNLSEMLAQGFESKGGLSHGPVTYAVSGTDPEQGDFTMNGSAERGSIDFALGKDGLAYGGSNSGIQVSFTSPTVPFPDMSFRIAETTGRIEMPVGTSSDPQDVGMTMRLVGLSISDTLWNMFDPATVLPRDPATVVLDVAGKANWLVDIFDPAIAENPPETPPGQLHELTVKELLVSAAGAELTGAGQFAVDNSAGPMPQPAGTLNLKLVGGNGLIDKLVQMGMLPEDQAMGARMMLGLFARPGEGTDTLVSEITVQPDGAILANGQRIK